MPVLPSTYEPIMNALFALLTSQLVPGTFRYASRRLVTWEQLISNQVPPNFQQPAMFLYDGIGYGGGKTRFEQRGRGRPVVRVITRSIVVYAQLPGGEQPPGPDSFTPSGSVFAPLSEAIEGIVGTPDGEGATNTLGGLVSHCWVDGDSHWLTGDMDPNGQGMFYINVQIMIP